MSTSNGDYCQGQDHCQAYRYAASIEKDRAELADACQRVGLGLGFNAPGAMTAAEAVDYLGERLRTETRRAEAAIEEARQWKSRITDA